MNRAVDALGSHKDIMITSRYITKDDYTLLANSIASDEYHKETTPDFFYEDNTVCSVFEDEDGPVLFVKATPFTFDSIVAIQFDIQYVKNEDAKRNMRAMLAGFPIIEDRARSTGFAGFLFQSESPLLRKFCVKRLGFYELNPQFLGKVLVQVPLDSETGDAV